MSPAFDWLFGTAGGATRGYLLEHPALLALHVTADVLIGLSYFAIAIGIAWFFSRRRDLFRNHVFLAWVVGAFVLAGGCAHLLDAAATHYAVYHVEGLFKAAMAVVAVAAVAFIWPLLPHLVRLPSAELLSEANQRLRLEVASHEATLRDLEAERRELEQRVEARTRELSLIKARFETALRGAKVYVFSQDRDLRYTWAYTPHGDRAANMVGRTDEEIFQFGESESVVAMKRRVLVSGVPEHCDVSYVMPQGRAVYALHVDPMFGADNTIDGITCAAIDISRLRSLESEQRRLTEELGATLQRYETALRGSNVTVFTQDRDLRYTSISNSMFGRGVDEILGRTDQDILPGETRFAVIAMKRTVLGAGEPRDGEVCIGDGPASHWYDLHIEPLRDVTGSIVGLTCAAVDVTERKEGEAHLRLLLRELTHRSKNLLAVIQAMARTTAWHAPTNEAFLDQFGARLQALAAAHDLLIQERWHGASLYDLVRSQLGPYLDRSGAQIRMNGPTVVLDPDAAQNLGLALHELAANAATHGALSGPAGRVSITWRRLDPADDGDLELCWLETGGPDVNEPQQRGFGSLVIERNLARSLEAAVKLEFPTEGIRCNVRIPAAHVRAGR